MGEGNQNLHLVTLCLAFVAQWWMMMAFRKKNYQVQTVMVQHMGSGLCAFKCCIIAPLMPLLHSGFWWSGRIGMKDEVLIWFDLNINYVLCAQPDEWLMIGWEKCCLVLSSFSHVFFVSLFEQITASLKLFWATIKYTVWIINVIVLNEHKHLKELLLYLTSW